MSTKRTVENGYLPLVVYVSTIALASAILWNSRSENKASDFEILIFLVSPWLVASLAMAIHWTRKVQLEEKISPLSNNLTKTAFSRLWDEFPLFTFLLTKSNDNRSITEPIDDVDRSKIQTVGDILYSKLTVAFSITCFTGGVICIGMAAELVTLQFATRIVGRGMIFSLLKVFFSIVAINAAAIGIYGLIGFFLRKGK